MAKKRTRLSRRSAIDRLDMMVDLILKDVQIVIEVEAALQVANDKVVNDLTGINFYGADCYNSVRQSMGLFLALFLAKLFEIPSLKGQSESRRYNRSDVASIPLLVRLLKQKQCRSALIDRSRLWTPDLPFLAEAQMATCRHAIDEAITVYGQFRRTGNGRNACAKLKGFRDEVLAHTLLGLSLGKTPSYNDLFLLTDIARDVTGHATLAIKGNSRDLKDYENERVRVAKAFWHPALTAVAKVDTSNGN